MTARVSFMDRLPQDGYELRTLQAHWSGVPMFRIQAARDGVNIACVDCSAEPLDGGLRCSRCFSTTVGRRKAAS